jgi:hypothetical protein
MEEEFKILQKKDKITSTIIEKRMQELITFHNEITYMKTALIIKGCEIRMHVVFFCIVNNYTFAVVIILCTKM